MSATVVPTADELRQHLGAKGSSAKCPAHEDHRESLSIGEGAGGKVLFKCHTGCSSEAIIEALQARGVWPKPAGLTVAELAAAKNLPERLLRDSGFADDDFKGRAVVRIQYRDAQNGIICTRYRGAGDDGPRFWFRRGDQQQLYGLWRLRAEPVIVVEGETDSLALWEAGFNAIGVPGADAWRDSRFASALTQCATVYVHVEPDDGGKKFRAAFERSSLRERVRFFTVPGAKDPCELRARDATGFRAAIEPALSGAQPAGAAKQNAGGAPERPYLLLPVDELLCLQKPPQYVVDKMLEVNTAVGIVAPTECGKSLFVANVAACMATGRHFHGRPCQQGLIVYLWGEGQAGAARRIQAIERRYELGLKGSPFVLSKVATSLLDPIELERIRAAIAAAEAQYAHRLMLLVVDTLARFIAPGDESKTQDMGAFLANIDSLRADATALICHHPGHVDATRGRGSSSWKAALDAEYTLAKAGDVITVTCQKMKDGEKPAPFSFRIEPADTYMARDDGSPVQSVVLVPTDAIAIRPAVTGKAQKQLLAELERRSDGNDRGIWTEGDLREIARGLGMHKSTARSAVLGLRQLGYFTATVGGSRLAYVPANGTNGTKRDESTNSSRVDGDEKDDVPLGTSFRPDLRPERGKP